MASSTDRGTATASVGPSASWRASSQTKNALPTVASYTAASSASLAARPTRAETSSPTAGRSKPPSSTWVVPGSWAKVARGPVVSRQQTTTRTRSSRAVRARYCTSSCDGSSAPSKSSRTTSSGRLLAAPSTNRATSSNLRTRSSSDGSTPLRVRRSTGPGPAIPAVSNTRSTSRHGQYGGAPSEVPPRPHAVRTPLSRARPVSSSTSRVFPTPGPPTHTTRLARPRCASSRHPSSTPSSRSRPTNAESTRASSGSLPHCDGTRRTTASTN